MPSPGLFGVASSVGIGGGDLIRIAPTFDAVSGSRLATRRLALAPPAIGDYDELSALAADPATFRYSKGEGLGGEDSWAWLLRQAGHWALAGWGPFIVRESSGGFAGLVGLSDYRRGLGDDFDHCPEISWTIPAALTGRGFATEAAAAALEWTQRRLAARRAVCLIHPDNAASLRIAAKLGFTPFAIRVHKGQAVILLETVRPE